MFWGSNEFLKSTLTQLERDKRLSFWAFIKHKAEEDEKKDHQHIYLVPNGRLDTDIVANALVEYDTTNLLPIKVSPFKPSKFDDWCLYVLHDKAYLTSKGLVKKYHYQSAEIVASNEDYFRELYNSIDRSKLNRIAVIQEAVKTGESFSSLVKRGAVPMGIFLQAQKAYNLLYTEEMISRNTPDIDFIKGLSPDARQFVLDNMDKIDFSALSRDKGF